MNELCNKTSELIRLKIDALSESIVDRQYSLEPEIWEKYGRAGKEKSIRDTKYHLHYLAEALSSSSLSLFIDYISWLKLLFSELGFPEEALSTTLKCIQDELRESFPEEFLSTGIEYPEEALRKLKQMPSSLNRYISDEFPLSSLSNDYLQALLEGKRNIANQVILDAVKNGVGIKDIYLQVFQRTQYEIGRLWQTNQISVAQEHYCTAATQFIMSSLYPYIFSDKRKGLRIVVACVGDELHEIGARMVADFFEMDGWDTYYLGANTPNESILKAVVDQEADILAISATITFHIRLVRELINIIRSTELNKDVKIMVGGYPFNVDQNLWRKLEADGYAPDAQEAVSVANTIRKAGWNDEFG